MTGPVSKMRSRRSTVYVDKDFQAKFILKFSALVTAGAGLTMALLYFFTKNSSTISIINARVRLASTADVLLPVFLQTVLVVSAVVGVAAFVVTLFVSHKIAGPLYRFKNMFRELSQGNFTNQVRLRKSDQLQEAATEFNQMITAVRNQIHIANQALDHIREDIEAIGESHVDESRRRKLTDVKLRLQQLEDALKFFRT